MKWFCSHDWPEWSQIVVAYSGVYQYRACNKCNKAVKRRVSFCSNDVNISAWNTDKSIRTIMNKNEGSDNERIG